ncbi:MAG TPA: DNA polymerase III subunit chi [Methylocystis sp.]|nr:DNA polymerase III subunit chi [Methylocystis sp.]
MTEVCFYHLTRRRLDRALPVLLEKSLARGWRVVVQAESEARVKALDQELWTYEAEKFLPHGCKSDGAAQTQPIYLTAENDNPNGADVRFFVGGVIAAPALKDPAAAPKTRAVLMFDGNDEAELSAARAQWKELRGEGFELVYYQENENGGWVEKAREKKT